MTKRKSGSPTKRARKRTTSDVGTRVRRLVGDARAEIKLVQDQDRELRVTLGHTAIHLDRLRKQRRMLVRVISLLVRGPKLGVLPRGDDSVRLSFDDIDAARTIGFAIDGDELVILPPLEEDPDAGPVDRSVIGVLEAEGEGASLIVAAEAGADAILSLNDDEDEGLGQSELACCSSAHRAPDGSIRDNACERFEASANPERCVYCDHEAKCHPGSKRGVAGKPVGSPL